MSRKGKTLVQCSLYCLNCGEKGLPIWRDRSKLHTNEHRKVMYCPRCRETVNHIELQTPEQVDRFRADLAAGKYRDEAAASIEYVKRH